MPNIEIFGWLYDESNLLFLSKLFLMWEAHFIYNLKLRDSALDCSMDFVNPEPL